MNVCERSGKMGTAPGRTEEKRSGAPLRRGGVPQKIYWEGINLNKISKKIVSLVTTAAFLTTLVPAAAFAADLNTGTANQNATVTLKAGTEQNIVLDSNGEARVVADVTTGTDWASLTDGQLVFWAEQADQIVDEETVSYTADDSKNVVRNDTGAFINVWAINQNITSEDDFDVTATITEEGTYKLYSGIYTPNNVDIDHLTAVAELGTVNVYDPVATPVSNDDVSMSIDGTSNNTANVTVGEAEDVNYTIGDDNMLPFGQNLYIWASADSNNATPIGVIDVAGATATKVAGVYQLANPAVSPVKVTFNVDGNYTLFLGYGSSETNRTVLQKINVVASNPEVVTSLITFDQNQADGTIARVVGSSDKSSEWTYAINDAVVPNDVKTYTVTGVAYQKDGKVAANEELTVTSAADDITVKTATVKTLDDGSFKIQFTMDDPGSYDIVVANAADGVKATLKVVSATVAPDKITTTQDGGVLLAGNDINYIDNPVSSMADAFQFEITDTYGHEQTGSDVLVREGASANNSDRSDYIKVTAPKASELNANDLVLEWDSKANAYTLFYVGKNAAKDLVAGEYTVEVSLNNGKKAKASFTVANFGDIEELTLDLSAQKRDADNAQNNSIVELDDQVALGQRVYVTPMYVDGNGLKIKADKVSLSATGAAVESRNLNGANPSFDLFWNIPSNQSLLGTIITVQAYDETNHNYVEKELTVVDALQNETLAFDPIKGEVGESNTVNVTVVDADGNLSKVNGTMSAYIADQSNEDATIDLDVQKNVVNGEGKLFLKSDAEGTVDVVVAVKATNGEIYANTLTYTFGKEDPYAGSYIVMTIGSDQYLINGEIFDGSVDNLGAPYIDSAWRTMVPVRILAETFGASVDYTDGVVTIVDGDTTVVMTVGEDTYTVNGEEQTMDTAPVIGDGDRTYVPVRFVAEALGYNVTPMYLNGLTSAVHFSK